MIQSDWRRRTPNGAELKACERRLREWLDADCSGVTTDEAIRRATTAHADFLTVLGHRVERPLNDALAAMLPTDGIEAKSALCIWLTKTLLGLGLAVHCPRSQRYGGLMCDTGNDNRVGRFQLRCYGPENGVRRITLSSTQLPRLSFVPRLRVAEAAEARIWTDTITRDGSEPRR